MLIYLLFEDFYFVLRLFIKFIRKFLRFNFPSSKFLNFRLSLDERNESSLWLKILCYERRRFHESWKRTWQKFSRQNFYSRLNFRKIFSLKFLRQFWSI